MGCGGQDLRHLGSGFELGAIFTFKHKPSPLCHRFVARGRARRGAVCSPLIVSRRPRAVGRLQGTVEAPAASHLHVLTST